MLTEVIGGLSPGEDDAERNRPRLRTERIVPDSALFGPTLRFRNWHFSRSRQIRFTRRVWWVGTRKRRGVEPQINYFEAPVIVDNDAGAVSTTAWSHLSRP